MDIPQYKRGSPVHVGHLRSFVALFISYFFKFIWLCGMSSIDYTLVPSEAFSFFSIYCLKAVLYFVPVLSQEEGSMAGMQLQKSLLVGIEPKYGGGKHTKSATVKQSE